MTDDKTPQPAPQPAQHVRLMELPLDQLVAHAAVTAREARAQAGASGCRMTSAEVVQNFQLMQEQLILSANVIDILLTHLKPFLTIERSKARLHAALQAKVQPVFDPEARIDEVVNSTKSVDEVDKSG